MKFATFEQDGREMVGRIEGDHVHPVDVTDMLDLITRYDTARPGSGQADRGFALFDIRLLAPLPRPRRNIFCVGKNYRAHAHEFARSGYEAGAIAGAEVDDYPAIFTKPASCVVGPGETVQTHPSVTSAVDYEGELAVVIGRSGRDIPRTAAMDHVFGYTIVNDVTARDRQKNHRQWFLGKALDTFCPMGPWITTKDEVAADELQLRTYVNGELRQDANTRDLIFDIPSLIETLSAGMMLQAGDVIATGTPAGVGLGFTPPRFLGPGDEVAVTITGLGTLRNPFG